MKKRVTDMFPPIGIDAGGGAVFRAVPGALSGLPCDSVF
jgi:hypothetical protein